MPPDFVEYEDAQSYFEHYKSTYCRETITTTEGVRVYFKQDKFWHAFYEADPKTGRKKQTISEGRAKRINWIKAAIESASAEHYKGYHENQAL